MCTIKLTSKKLKFYNTENSLVNMKVVALWQSKIDNLKTRITPNNCVCSCVVWEHIKVQKHE